MTKITEILSIGGSKGLRIGGTDVNEYTKEQVAIAIAIAEQSKKLEQPEPKWYDNIPEQGVLCWCGDYGNEHFTDRNVHNIVRVTEGGGKFVTLRGTPWKIAVPLTNEEIEEFKR